MSDHHPQVYLAGPEVFLPDPYEAGRVKKIVCSRHGLDGVFPLDAQLDLGRVAKHVRARTIFQICLRLITTSDALIANMTPFRGPSMDVGTAFELGYAAALGKPVFGYSEDLRDYAVRWNELVGGAPEVSLGEEGAVVKRIGDRLVVSEDGTTVEDFGLPDNLMVAIAAGIFAPIAPDFEGAVRAAAGHLGLTQTHA